MSLSLEHLTPFDSSIARWDARWKLAALLIAMVLVAVVRSPIVAVAGFILALGLALFARIPRRWLRNRLSAVAFAMLPIVIILPLTDAGGFAIAVALTARGLAITVLALVLIASAPLPTTLHAAQRLRVPSLLIHLTLMSYRYVFLLAEEFDRLRVALRVRAFRNRMNRQSYQTIGKVTGTLLVRGNERAERVSHAMRCRGFDGQFHCLHDFQTVRTDVVLFFVSVAVAVGLLVIDLYLRGEG